MITSLLIFLISSITFFILGRFSKKEQSYLLLSTPKDKMNSFMEEVMKAYGLTSIKIKKEERTWEVGNGPLSFIKEIQGLSILTDKRMDSWQLDLVVSDFVTLIKKEEMESALEASSKLSALGEMAAGIAHEINNPLAIVHGKSHMMEMLLEEEEMDKAQVQEQLRDVIDTVERMDKIINSLRYFVRDDKRDPLVMASTKEILDNVQVLSIDRCRKQGIKVLVEGETGELYCKPTQISQVLINLVNNAFDAIKDQEGVRWIKVSSCIKEKSVIFEVSDSGTGLSKEVGDQILNSFYTTKKFNKNSGLGLGLNIARRIIEAHFGKINIDYNSQNTKFVVEIPRTQVLSNQTKDVA